MGMAAKPVIDIMAPVESLVASLWSVRLAFREGYTEAKGPFVERVLRALREAP